MMSSACAAPDDRTLGFDGAAERLLPRDCRIFLKQRPGGDNKHNTT